MPNPPEQSARPLRLVVIDGANAVYRAFFAIPHLRAPDGSPTNAALGFVTMLGKLIREERPDYLVVAFDPRGGSFRNQVYQDYKAGRDAQPEDLSAQIPLVRELVEAHRVPLLEVEKFEADDVIATLVEQAPDDVDVTIVSTDKDLMQLVSERVTLVDGIKDRRYGPREVEERFGVPPESMLDLRSLVGDPSDNIPGVKGIGEKGAAKLINEWKTLENLLQHVPDVKAKRAREALQEHADDARLSKELASLRRDLALPGLEELRYQGADRERLLELYRRLGFSRLIDALVAEDPDPAAVVESDLEVVTVTDAASLETELAALGPEEDVPLLLLAGEGSALSAKPVGLAFAIADERSLYLPFVGEGLAATEGLDDRVVTDVVAGLLSRVSGPRGWLALDTKACHSLFAERGLELPMPRADLGVAAFLIDPAGSHGIDALAAQYLGRSVPSWEQVAGRGAKATPAEEFPVERAAAWAGAAVNALRALAPVLRQRIDADGLADLYDEIERPLTRVLSRMERNGVRIDEQRLADLSAQYEVELARLEGEIYALAGEEFKVNSPKQLQVILFEKLGLRSIKKTKTGYSTDEAVLEQLAAEHELPARILAWRRLSKLKSTYIDAIPPLVNPNSGRVHPVFHQNGAATGRMSASHPNVQNIPIRSEDGVRIREAFVPSEGSLLLSADYSQVELRILAHYSGDESLIDAFARGEDIHRRTAAEVAGIEPQAVSDDQRARAKAVNFGIIYGSSAFGLANQLGIASGEARETIDAYFARYRGVRTFLDETVADAKERGFVTTLLGRRRYLPDLASRNRVLRQAAERMAVNSVIQGTAADLIKGAMVAVDRALAEGSLRALLMLQVHDELVFEVACDEVEELSELVRQCMQGVFELCVPLVVDVGTGETWREAH